MKSQKWNNYSNSTTIVLDNDLVATVYTSAQYTDGETVSLGIYKNGHHRDASWLTESIMKKAGFSIEGRSYDDQVARNLSMSEVLQILAFASQMTKEELQ